MNTPTPQLARLSAWYAAQCDGEWEHGFGIDIATLDLRGTNFEQKTFAEIIANNGDNNWL